MSFCGSLVKTMTQAEKGKVELELQPRCSVCGADVYVCMACGEYFREGDPIYCDDGLHYCADCRIEASNTEEGKNEEIDSPA